jgi:hypothetical protein
MMTPAHGLRIPKLVNKANFREHLTGEVRGIPLLGTSVNKGQYNGADDPPPRLMVPLLARNLKL